MMLMNTTHIHIMQCKLKKPFQKNPKKQKTKKKTKTLKRIKNTSQVCFVNSAPNKLFRGSKHLAS